MIRDSFAWRRIPNEEIGRLFAIAEQIVYTSFSLFVFVFTIVSHEPEIAAINLGLIALLNIPVPFQAIQIGWRKSAEDSFWLGSSLAQVVMVALTVGAIYAYMRVAELAIDAMALNIIAAAGFVAVWSNGMRWLFIKNGDFLYAIFASVASLAGFLLVAGLGSIKSDLGVFIAVVIAKSIFFLALLVGAIRRKGLSFSKIDGPDTFDLSTIILACSRFMRTNGVFAILTTLAPNAAIAGRLVQQAIAICRVIQNPLANYTFFHRPSQFASTIKIQILFGGVIALLFYPASSLFGDGATQLLGSIAVFCATLGFVGIYALRQGGQKNVGIAFESISALALLTPALLLHDTGGFIYGLILSECILFAALFFADKK